MNLSFFIAKRYLVSKKSHNAINIISGISVMGICIGTLALVIVLSAFNGLSDLVHSLYDSFDADIQITIKEGKTFYSNTASFQQIKQLKGVHYFTNIVQDNALVKCNDQQSLATIKGVSADFEKMTRFDTVIRGGQFLLKKGDQEFAVLGKGISYQLNVNPMDFASPLSFYAPKRGIQSSLIPTDAFNQINTVVSGVFSINDDFDYQYAIVPIDFARRLFDYKKHEVSAVELGLQPGADDAAIQAQIEKILGPKFSVKNKYQQNALLFKTLKSEKLWTFIILVFILIVATFNVIGSLTMLIIDKKKDITILWNMGADIKLIRRIFLFEGLLITLIGAILGILLGIFICWLQIQFKLIRFDQGYVVSAYPVSMQVLDFVKILFSVLLIGLFAAWYPVRIFTRKHLKNVL